jgi:predicted dienelactone hydrolase
VQRAARLILVSVLLISTYGQAATSASESLPGRAPSSTPFNSGFKVVPVADGRKMALWYPTSDAESDFQYFPSLRSTLAREGAPANSRQWPLVVFSHGFGGCGTQSVFFTEALARRGYVVAAPDHKDALCGVDGSGSLRFIKPDESFSRPQNWNETTQVDRKNDLQQAIRWVLNAAEFGRQIDRSRIGLVGHSLGGYTVLGLAGGWKSWKDDRVKAVLLFSPYAAPFLVQHRLPSIQIPVMYQAADRDRLITVSSLGGDQGAYGASNPPKYYVQLRDGNHFEWTNLLCVGKKTVAECLSTKPNARLINVYGIAFLDSHLKQQVQVLQRLDGSGLDDYRQMGQ